MAEFEAQVERVGFLIDVQFHKSLFLTDQIVTPHSVEGRRHAEFPGSLGCCLQTLHVGQCGHLAVQRQGLQPGP